MTLYTVWVMPDIGYRWIDSSWVEEAHAITRKEELRTALDIAGNTKFYVKVVSLTCADARLGTSK